MKLMIFFNGWGMDSKSLNLESCENLEILFLQFPYIVPDIDKSLYEEIYIVAWSFGVYYANLFLHKFPQWRLYKNIAINGTPCMIGQYGISKKMMNFTLATLEKDTLQKFYLNMGNTQYFTPPEKSIEDLKSELEFFIANYEEYKNHFKKALISLDDRIVPGKNQSNYWSKLNIPYSSESSGHFPFNNFFDIHDILRLVENEI